MSEPTPEEIEEFKKEKEKKELAEEVAAKLRKEGQPLRGDDDGGGNGGRKGGGGFNLWGILLPAALAVIVVLGLSQFGYLGGVKPETYNGFVDYVQTNFALKTDIPTIPDLTQYAKQSDLPDMSNYATQSDLDDVSAPDLSGYVTIAQYNALADRVADLEAGGGGSGGGGGATDGLVTCELKAYSSLAIPNSVVKEVGTANFSQNSNEIVYVGGTPWNADMIGGLIQNTDKPSSWYLITAIDGNKLTIGRNYAETNDAGANFEVRLPTDYQFKATLTNTGSQDLEDVVFVFSITDISYYAGFDGVWTLTSDYFGWEQWGFAAVAPVFRSQLWGFSMDAGDDGITIYPTLSLALTQIPTYSVMFDAGMECEDYDIAD